ncbi:hypothetical protein LSAT2_003861, partial [Lamellibrachia satsuma]
CPRPLSAGPICCQQMGDVPSVVNRCPFVVNRCSVCCQQMLILLSEQVSSGKCFIRGLLSLLFTLWLTITYPLQSLLPQHLQQTPTRDNILKHPPEWDHSFSDGG